MKTNSIIRILAVIILVFTATTHAEAQFGNALKKAKDAAKQATKSTPSQNNNQNKPASITESISNQVSEAAGGEASLTPEQREAWHKIKDESKREAPIIYVFTDDAERGHAGGRRDFLGKILTGSQDSARAFKQELEARNNENIALTKAVTFDQLKQAFPKNTDIFDGKYRAIEKEMKDYQEIIDYYRYAVSNFADVKVSGGQATVNRIQVGVMSFRFIDDEPYFTRTVDGKQVIVPADETMYEIERNRYNNIVTMVRKEPPAEQYPEYAVGQVTNQFIFQAQKNSIRDEEKQPVPTPKMNDANLSAKMLKLAQEGYPKWGIEKLIIDESAWRPEHDALGNIIHRRINTKIILPRKSGGYIMRTLSFIEPYEGGGKYGEVRPFGIGTDEVAVNYRSSVPVAERKPATVNLTDEKKKEYHERIDGYIEKGKNETDYDKLLDAYTMGFLMIESPVWRGEASCEDYELDRIWPELEALYAKTKTMYDELTAQGKKPNIEPRKLIDCDENLMIGHVYRLASNLKINGSASSKEAKAIPKEVTPSAALVKQITDFFTSSGRKDDFNEIGEFKKLIFLANEWKEVKVKREREPYGNKSHYRYHRVGVIVKLPHEKLHRLYQNCHFAQHYDLGTGKLTDRFEFIVNGFMYVDYK